MDSKIFRSGISAGKYSQQNLVGTYIEKFLQEGNSAPKNLDRKEENAHEAHH